MAAPPSLPPALLVAALSRDPGRPLVTWYDDRTGERVELSVATTANWVAKTANLLAGDLGLGPGSVVALDLPRHWLLPVVALATWTVGAALAPGADPATADLAVCGPAGLDAARTAPEVLAVSLAPLGAPFPPGTLPPGVLDLAREVPAQPDRYTAGPTGSASDPALVAADLGGTLDQADVVQAARALAIRLGVAPGGRLLLAGTLSPTDGVLAAAVLPLATGSSVVLVANADPARLGARAAAERATATA